MYTYKPISHTGIYMCVHVYTYIHMKAYMYTYTTDAQIFFSYFWLSSICIVHNSELNL